MDERPGISPELKRLIFITFICAIAFLSFFCVDWSHATIEYSVVAATLDAVELVEIFPAPTP